jgi:hypothetical protein
MESGKYGAQMPGKQKSAFHNDSAIGKTNAKANRKTGEQSKGSAVMRSAQYGKSDGADKASNAA